MFIPATVTKLTRLESDGPYCIELTLPNSITIQNKECFIQDGMRPGTGFWIESWDEPTIRSNCSINAKGRLQAMIWRTEGIIEGGILGVRVQADPKGNVLRIEESKGLALELDSWWCERDFAAIAFSTGIAPFLAYVRYMSLFAFGRALNRFGRGAHFVLVVSVKEPRQLICHDELLTLEDRFPEHFRYHPALTREWTEDWPYTRRRVIRMEQETGRIDLSPLLEVVPDIDRRHVRISGGKESAGQLLKGLQDNKISPLSIRTQIS